MCLRRCETVEVAPTGEQSTRRRLLQVKVALVDREVWPHPTRERALATGPRIHRGGFDTEKLDCCESTARDASTLGYRVIMVADANAARRDQDLNATLHTIYRTFGDVRPTAEVVGLIASGVDSTSRTAEQYQSSANAPIETSIYDGDLGVDSSTTDASSG